MTNPAEQQMSITRKTVEAAIRKKPGVIDIHTHIGMDISHALNRTYPYGLSGQDMIVRMERTRIDYSVVFPHGYTEYFALRPYLKSQFRKDRHSFSSCPHEFENQRICNEVYEAFPEFAGRLLPFAFFDPSRRPRRQTECIAALAKRYPIFGLKTVTSYNQSHITDLLRQGSCLLDLAAANDWPVTIHTAVIKGDPWANVFDILKVVEARPEVRFNLAHTCRFDQRALERADELPNCWVDYSAFHIHCLLAKMNHGAVAAKPHRFRTDYRRHAVAMGALAKAYPDTMLWGTDAPANLFKSHFVNDAGQVIRMDLPCEVDTETDELRKLPRSLQRRITYTNNMRFLFG